MIISDTIKMIKGLTGLFRGGTLKAKILLLVIVAGVITCAGKSTPKSIPEGTWNYDLIVNGVKAGKGIFSNSIIDGNYVVKSELYINMGPIENKAVYIVTETMDFKPVKLEVYNTTIDKSTDGVQEINKIAVFKGAEVTLQAGDKKSKFKIDEDFTLDGNYFISQLIKNKFKQGTIVEARIYEPLVEIDSAILALAEVKGYSAVDVGKKSMKLLHLKYRVENLKSMDMYLNEHGVTEKMVMKMLNFELIMERVE